MNLELQRLLSNFKEYRRVTDADRDAKEILKRQFMILEKDYALRAAVDEAQFGS